MNKQAEDIKAIREMMEKSSKFLSLSGLSGIVAGVAAILGAAFAYFYVLRDSFSSAYDHTQKSLILLVDALLVLFISIGFCIYFSWRKAKKNKQQLFNSATRRVIYNLAVPLVAGGIFSLVFLLRYPAEFTVAFTLIFYGLALLNASKYTFEEIHYLGITEIVLGLLAIIFVPYSVLFWTIGFGFCHIIYGLVLFIKYDVKKK